MPISSRSIKARSPKGPATVKADLIDGATKGLTEAAPIGGWLRFVAGLSLTGPAIGIPGVDIGIGDAEQTGPSQGGLSHFPEPHKEIDQEQHEHRERRQLTKPVSRKD